MVPVSEVTHDRRLLRGAQSRRTIVRHAVDVASLDGLDGLSFGRLATDLGVSKGGIQTLFGTKETLQVAVAEAAREAFEEAGVRGKIGARPIGHFRYRKRQMEPGLKWTARSRFFRCWSKGKARPGPNSDSA